MTKKRSAPEAEDETPVRSRDELMDSLPYIDVPNEDYEEYALALIEAEMKEIPPPKLRSLPPIKFRTHAMETEYRRFIETDGRPEPIQISLSTPTAPADTNSVEQWKDAVQIARTEYEAERMRGMNLEVKKDAGAALLWKGFNGNLDQDLQAMQALLKQQKEMVERINLARSEDQQKAGQQLQVLTHQYQEALQRRFQLQQAMMELEQEVQELTSS